MKTKEMCDYIEKEQDLEWLGTIAFYSFIAIFMLFGIFLDKRFLLVLIIFPILLLLGFIIGSTMGD